MGSTFDEMMNIKIHMLLFTLMIITTVHAMESQTIDANEITSTTLSDLSKNMLHLIVDDPLSLIHLCQTNKKLRSTLNSTCEQVDKIGRYMSDTYPKESRECRLEKNFIVCTVKVHMKNY